MNGTEYTEIPTAFGSVGIAWTGPASRHPVQRIVLSGNRIVDFPVEPPFRAREPNDPRLGALVEGIRRFLEGSDVQFDLGILDLEQCPPFQRKVLLAEAGIPRGYVSTYGRIAAHIGHPGAGRAVGNALARNPFPVVIPCHRAIRSDGELGGFQEGPAMKRRLLEMEGVRFLGDGRVAMDRVWY